MEQLILGQFKGKTNKKEKDSWAKFRDDEFENLCFESEIIKQFDLQENKVFKYKETLSCKRGLNKKNKLEFNVYMEFEYPEYPDSDLDNQTISPHTNRQKAIDFFENEKFRCEWEMELNKENQVWDGRRYVLLLDKKDKVIKRVI